MIWLLVVAGALGGLYLWKHSEAPSGAHAQGKWLNPEGTAYLDVKGRAWSRDLAGEKSKGTPSGYSLWTHGDTTVTVKGTSFDEVGAALDASAA